MGCRQVSTAAARWTARRTSPARRRRGRGCLAIERNELFDLILAADRRGRLRDVNVGGWHQQSGDCLRLLKRAAAERLGE